MPCQVDINPSEEANHFEVMLCKAFKFLTKEQIAQVTNPGSGMYDGLDWYKQHLMCDYGQKCHREDVLDFNRETNDHQKQIILSELNRIGYTLIVEPGMISLVELNNEEMRSSKWIL